MMGKLIDVQSAREVADAIFGDPILKMAVNAVLNNTEGFDLVKCEECKKTWCYLRQELGNNGFCSCGER